MTQSMDRWQTCQTCRVSFMAHRPSASPVTPTFTRASSTNHTCHRSWMGTRVARDVTRRKVSVRFAPRISITRSGLGYELSGAHARARCADCHARSAAAEPHRRIVWAGRRPGLPIVPQRSACRPVWTHGERQLLAMSHRGKQLWRTGIRPSAALTVSARSRSRKVSLHRLPQTATAAQRWHRDSLQAVGRRVRRLPRGRRSSKSKTARPKMIAAIRCRLALALVLLMPSAVAVFAAAKK